MNLSISSNSASSKISLPSIPPPCNLVSLLVEIQNPEDTEECCWAKTFRNYLIKTEEENLLDFVIICNVLRKKELDVKVLRKKIGDNPAVYIPSKDAVLNKERRDLLKLLGDTFLSDDCIMPVHLNNGELIPRIYEAMDNISNLKDGDDDEKQSDYLSSVFNLVWQARCDYKVWRQLETKYNNFLVFMHR